MIDIQIEKNYQPMVDSNKIANAISSTFIHQKKVDPIALCLLVTNNQEVHKLNLEYRNIDRPTDVLSFSSNEFDPETNTRYWGDIVISYSIAADHAKSGGHSAIDEILLLSVHGCLHLLGHDHYEDDEKEIMWKAQDEILTTLNVAVRPINK